MRYSMIKQVFLGLTLNLLQAEQFLHLLPWDVKFNELAFPSDESYIPRMWLCDFVASPDEIMGECTKHIKESIRLWWIPQLVNGFFKGRKVKSKSAYTFARPTRIAIENYSPVGLGTKKWLGGIDQALGRPALSLIATITASGWKFSLDSS